MFLKRRRTPSRRRPACGCRSGRAAPAAVSSRAAISVARRSAGTLEQHRVARIRLRLVGEVDARIGVA